MNLFKKKKIEKSTEVKKSVQKWLDKLIAPEITDRMNPFKLAKMKPHIHSIEGVTARAKGHQEHVSVSTGKPIVTKDGHIHEYSGAVFSENKQVHRIEGVTNSADGQGYNHTHKISGRTSKDGNHAHKYSIETSGIVPKQEKRMRRIFQKQKTVLDPSNTVNVLPVEPK